jgi:hypothetical protein
VKIVRGGILVVIIGALAGALLLIAPAAASASSCDYIDKRAPKTDTKILKEACKRDYVVRTEPVVVEGGQQAVLTGYCQPGDTFDPVVPMTIKATPADADVVALGNGPITGPDGGPYIGASSQVVNNGTTAASVVLDFSCIPAAPA